LAFRNAYVYGFTLTCVGVTLNHLAWASSLGAPTSLLALQVGLVLPKLSFHDAVYILQGDDENGKLIREKLAELNVSSKYIQHGPEYATSVSHIILNR
jgi:hypothetical protein